MHYKTTSGLHTTVSAITAIVYFIPPRASIAIITHSIHNYYCPDCNKRFDFGYAREEHQKSTGHAYCRICERYFSGAIDTHMQALHTQDSKMSAFVMAPLSFPPCWYPAVIELFNQESITSFSYHFLHILTHVYQQCYSEQHISHS